MQVSQVRKLKDLERVNARPKKLVAEQALDKAILEDAIPKTIVDLASGYGWNAPGTVDMPKPQNAVVESFVSS